MRKATSRSSRARRPQDLAARAAAARRAGTPVAAGASGRGPTETLTALGLLAR